MSKEPETGNNDDFRYCVVLSAAHTTVRDARVW